MSIEPINVSKENVSGILAGLTYRFGGGRGGMFQVNLDYNRTLDHDYTQFQGDDPIDALHTLLRDIDYAGWLEQNASSPAVAERRFNNVLTLIDGKRILASEMEESGLWVVVKTTAGKTMKLRASQILRIEESARK